MPVSQSHTLLLLFYRHSSSLPSVCTALFGFAPRSSSFEKRGNVRGEMNIGVEIPGGRELCVELDLKRDTDLGVHLTKVIQILLLVPALH